MQRRKGRGEKKGEEEEKRGKIEGGTRLGLQKRRERALGPVRMGRKRNTGVGELRNNNDYKRSKTNFGGLH